MPITKCKSLTYRVAQRTCIFILCAAVGVSCAAKVSMDTPSTGSAIPVTLPATPPATVLPSLGVGMPSREYIAERLGVDLGGVGERALEFFDVAKTLRRWENVDADACSEGDDTCRFALLDASGYPTTDARTVFFDKRPFGAWWGQDQENCPLCQDGTYQIDVSGTYKLSFTGQAVLQGVEDAVTVQNQVYNKTSNTTTADVIVLPGQGLLFMAFVDTQRTPDSGLDTGIANVHLMRPGYRAETPQTFTPYIVDAVKPFSTLRFMNWVGGNNINPPFDPDSDCTLDWNERNLPTARQNQNEGVAWEYVIELANLTGKNIWINIPIHATDDYILGLAHLLKDTLHPDALIYIESSNEVWNPIFSQEAYNRLAAEHEVRMGDTNLDSGQLNLTGLWAQRRHVRRLVEISENFRTVFGADAINDKIRVIHSWWALEPGSYQSQLQWVQDTFGPPDQYFYAVAAAGYFNSDGVRNTTSIDDLILRLLESSNSQTRGARVNIQKVADLYGLRHAMYEGGPDTASVLQWDRDSTLLQTVLDLHYDERMGDLIIHDLWHNWFANPDIQGDIFIYFTLQSLYSRWGMWGLTEDITNLQTPKFRAIYNLVGMELSAPSAPLGLKAKAGQSPTVNLSWQATYSADWYTVKRALSVEGPYAVIAENVVDTLYEDVDELKDDVYYYTVSASNQQGESRDAMPAFVELNR